jgi:outer membrane cobalamin receptor
VQTGAQFVPGQPLLRRPKHSGSLRVSYQQGPVTLSMTARFIGQRHDSAFLSLRSVSNPSFPQSVTTDITVNPGYAVVGLLLDVRAHRSVSLFIRGDNVADSVYETALGYPGLPRAVVVGVRAQLGR